MYRIALPIIFMLSLLIACKNKNTQKVKKPIVTTVDSNKVNYTGKEAYLLQLTDSILLAFKNKNYSSLVNFLDPDSGVRFSPYGYVDTLHHLIVTKEQFANEVAKTKQDKMIWGYFDGSGDTINMTINEYVQKFVYDVDFIAPEKRKVNEFIGHGNSLNNIQAVYKDCDFTESHFSGFDKQYEGMDWRSLRLVFRKSGEKYFLTAVVHDQWTI